MSQRLMTWEDLRGWINSMPEDRLKDNVAIAVIGNGDVEVYPTTDFVDPSQYKYHAEFDQEAVYLDEINDSILDDGHCYLTVFT